MKAFVSWSSGKDCMHALYHFLKNPENQAVCLLNMSGEGNGQPHSHGISSAMIRKQAARLNIPLLQKTTSRGNYEKNMKEAIARLKSEGVDAGVFGDIYLQEHRTWIAKQASLPFSRFGAKALPALWNNLLRKDLKPSSYP
jgi:diphthamide synthase (EF-2-diphthine--ammonia ligase)